MWQGLHAIQSCKRGASILELEKVPTGGNFLNAKSVKDLRITTVKIESEGELVTFEAKDGKKQEKVSLKISFQGQRPDDPDSWTLNNKSRNSLIELFGGSTPKWVGQTVELKLDGTGEYEHITVDEMRTKKA